MVQKPAAADAATGGTDGRSARSEQTRAKLLAAATELIATYGVGALTLERVAATAGVSKGGLLYHFGTKQELVVALLMHTLRDADDRLEDLAGDGEPGAFATAYLDYVRSSEHIRRGAAVGIFASAALDEGELAPAQDQFAAWQHRLVRDDGIDPTVALLARIVGDGLWLIDLFGLAPPSETDRKAVLDLVQTMIGESASA